MSVTATGNDVPWITITFRQRINIVMIDITLTNDATEKAASNGVKVDLQMLTPHKSHWALSHI